MSELLAPNRKDVRAVFEAEFRTMIRVAVTVEELEGTRERLIGEILSGLTRDERRFLLSFKSQEPDWTLLALPNVDLLPAVRWKLMNLAKKSEYKHEAAFAALREVLGDV